MLGLTLGLLACAVLATPQKTATPLEVVSYNIRFGTAEDGENHWRFRREALLKQVGDMKPDVLGLQEALRSQIDEITAAHPYLASFGVGRDDGVAAGEHSPILYRRDRLGLLRGGTFWLSDTPDVIASKTWGNQITRICTYALFQDRETGQRFWVFNAHLDHQSQPSREKSTALMLSRARDEAKTDPVLILGDFNAGEENPAVKAILASGYRDTFRVLHPDVREVGTFTAFEAPGEDKIDYVFASPHWTVERAEIRSEKVDGRFPSDHFPVTARVRL